MFVSEKDNASTVSLIVFLLPDCGQLPIPTGGRVDIPGNTTYGQIATYSCLPGYDIQGRVNLSCEESGKWSGSANCIIKGDVTQTPIPTFENVFVDY